MRACGAARAPTSAKGGARVLSIPGSRLVKRLLNPLKSRYGMRFADLLKPTSKARR